MPTSSRSRASLGSVRIAFYAPLKPPTHAVPSGDRRVAGLLMDALERVADHIELVSTFRSFDGDGDGARQEALRSQGAALAERLVQGWRAAPPELRPTLWFTYHVYYKAPDWLGPAVSAALGIPYVIAEASYAEKRAGGPWAIGHEAAAEAIAHARLVLSPSRDDVAGLEAAGPEGAHRALSAVPRRRALSRRAEGTRRAPRAPRARARARSRGALDRGRGDDARGRQGGVVSRARRFARRASSICRGAS